MKRRVILTILIATWLCGCTGNRLTIDGLFRPDELPDCYELNRAILGEHTGRVCKSGDMLAYSEYTYKHQNYSRSKTDGLYVCSDRTGKKMKIADGIICCITMREDGIYYLKRVEKGKVFLYNYDLYRYCFDSNKNELIIRDCSYVQFSEDAVFYCQQYLSDKDSFVEYKMPLDLESEGKIVRRSLVTGEEMVVAESEGNIYNFLVTKNKIFFAAGEGNAFDGGRNVYMCDHDGNQMYQLTDNDCGYVKVLYADEEAGTILFYTGYKTSDGENKTPSGYSYLDYKASEMIWTCPDMDIPADTFGTPTFYKDNLYFCTLDDSGVSNELLCLSIIGRQMVSTIQVQDVCESLYVFDGKMYGVTRHGGRFSMLLVS